MPGGIQGYSYRLLDLTRLLPGPYASFLLSNLGIEVIKIEEPGRGDYLRSYPPFLNGESVFFQTINCGKKSLALNLKHAEGREIFKRLVQESDVLLEGFRPGTMEKLGLSYAELSKINPNLIFCSLTGYGQEGPWSNKAGHDLNYLALSGLLGLMARRNDRPVIPAIPIADLVGGTLAALAIVSALLARQAGGSGQYIDLAMLDGLLSWLSWPLAEFRTTGSVARGGEGLLSGGVVCYNVYRTKDNRYLTLAALEEKFWAQFCQATGKPELLPEQFAPAIDGEPVYESLKALFAGRTMEEWLELDSHGDLCLAPVLEIPEVLDHPQVKARGVTETFGGVLLNSHLLDQPQVQARGATETFGRVFFDSHLMDPPEAKARGVTEATLTSPRLGQHTAELLANLGYTAEQIRELREKGVIA